MVPFSLHIENWGRVPTTPEGLKGPAHQHCNTFCFPPCHNKQRGLRRAKVKIFPSNGKHTICLRRRKKEKNLIREWISGLILLLIVKFCGVLKQEKPGLKRRPIPKTVFSWAKYYIPPYGFLTPDKVTEPSSTPTHMTLRRGRVEVRRKKTYQKKSFSSESFGRYISLC